ncbi:hypothetical protein [Ciceribacter sp. RN22]|uniref:hypothetical protein n=1 Tax=Ciceribacter sp. RN22 TaxID=2954932 RepID=UPI002092020E|nr:hypothetical protein [Ciceribacter sp. RN22]MCO6179482.1 hypothetical protein [Ciceribacter sp. RN22]
MAVLHHAFRCPVTPAFEETVREVLSAWDAGDHEKLSAMALRRLPRIAEREDIQAAFRLDPDGAMPSWLQPEFVSPGLAALVLLADSFVPIPSLSAGKDTNHYLLTTHLPVLGWNAREVQLLVRGDPIEVMLARYSSAPQELVASKFRETGGWTDGTVARTLGDLLARLAATVDSGASPAVRESWNALRHSGAIDDARAMLAAVEDTDWLVTSVTH